MEISASQKGPAGAPIINHADYVAVKGTSQTICHVAVKPCSENRLLWSR